QEIAEELVAFCPQLNERNIEAHQVLTEKMELFRRLQDYYDAVRYMRNQNNVWNTITLSEVPTISSEMNRLLERCHSEWLNDALQLRRELVAISGSFFQLELNLLTFERDKLRDLMRIRLKYLEAVRDFISHTDSSIDAGLVGIPGGRNDRSPDVQNMAKQMCNELEEKAERVRQLQGPAEMVISDLSLSQLTRRYRGRFLGPINEENFDHMACSFESLIAKELLTTEDPHKLLSTIMELKREEELENRAFDDMNEVAISDLQRLELDRISAFYFNRREQRERLILTYTYTYHDYLNSLFCVYEDKVVQFINNRAQAELLKFNENEWQQWKENVGALESILDASMRVRFRPEFADLQRKAFSLDNKISKSITSTARQRRHEEKLGKKLEQFECWLNAVEDDLAAVELLPAGSLQTKRLSQLLSNCFSYQRLVGKLERLNVHSRDHVLQLCRRYYVLLNKLRRHSVDEASLPIHVDTLVQGVSTPSQLSVSSLASSDLIDRPGSVQSVCSSVDVARASVSSETYLERAVSDLRGRLHCIIQSYNEGPKSIRNAKEDYNLILGYLEELNGLFTELALSDNAKKEAIGNSMIHLQQHLNETKSKLHMEIEEEKSLFEKEQEIIVELTRLEQRVKNRDVEDLNLIEELDQLQTQMDLLHMISSKPRHFVGSDIMERELSPGRSRQKRRVLMMVTNTVTTIIQVVEKRILSIEAHSRDPVVYQKLALVKTNLKILEKEVGDEVPEESIVTFGKDSQMPNSESEISALKRTKTTLNSEEIKTTVHKIEQVLDKAKDIGPKCCRDPSVLAKYLDILKAEEFSLNVLSDNVAEIAVLEGSDYLDRISALLERYIEVRNTLTDRIAELGAERSADNMPDIYSPDVPSNISRKGDIDKLVAAVRSAVDSAESIAFDESAKPQSLLKAAELLQYQEPVLSLLSDAAIEQANVGNADGIDLASSLTEQIRALKSIIDDRINQSGYEEESRRAFIIKSLHQLEKDVSCLENAQPFSFTSSNELVDFKQANIPSLLAKLDAITDIAIDLLPKRNDLSNRIETICGMLDDQLDEMMRFEEKTIKLQDIINDCNDKLKNRSELPIPIENIIKDVEDLSTMLATIDAIPQEDLSPRNQLARNINNVKEKVKEQLSTLQRTLTDEEDARERQNELRNRILTVGDGLRSVDVENPESAQKLVDSLDVELQKLRGIADSCHDFAMSFSPIASHDDLDKTLPEQIECLQKECDEKKKDIEQLIQLNRVTPEILQISECLQQQSDEIPHNLSEQQAVLVDLESKKQRLESLLQTIPDGDATEELRQRSAWDLSKLKDLLRKLGDSVGDKIAALAAFNAARKDTEDQLLLITSPESTEKTPEELKKDEDALCRLQQRFSEFDGCALDDDQRNEHAQLLDRLNKTLAAVKV
ncbi:hypothetical protein Angca_008861, partial [Angiostrongylus cantonensis]